MSLNKIRQANKKARHEQKRKTIRSEISRKKQHNKVQRKRVRAMFIEGQKEFQAKRRADKNYVAQLEAELAND